MLNSASRMWLAGGVWFVTLAVIVALSVAMDASLSTSALVLVMGLTPVIVIALLGANASSPTVPEVLHSVNARDGRS